MEKLQNQVHCCKPSLLNITFFIDSKSKFKTSVYSITKIIREMEGSISFTLNSKTDFIITTSPDYFEKLKQTSIINTIDKSKVCLISDEFFTISPDQRSSFKFTSLSNSTGSTNELISCSILIQDTNKNNNNNNNNNNVEDDQLKIIINPRHIPSVCYGVNEKRQPYFPDDYLILKSNLLSSTVIGKQNTNKFYYLELHQAIDSGNFKKYYRIYTQSGRTDEIHKSTSQHRYCNQGELKEAMDLYSSIYSQKIEDSNGYIEIEMTAITKIGSPLKLKQMNIQKQLDEKSNSTTVIFNEETGQLEESAIDFQRSYIDSNVCKLIETIYKETSKCLIKNFSLDVTENGIETQLGTLSIGQIDSAKLILNQIGKLLLLEQQPTTTTTEQFEKLSSKFFQLVPTKISSKKNKDCHGAIINNESSLIQHLELLDMMRDLTVAFNSNKLTNQSRNHLDMKYYALNIDIQHLHPASADYQIFIRNFTNSNSFGSHGTNSVHQQLIESGKLEILNVFKLKKDQEELQFQGDTYGNCKYLYHGSKSSNLVGLLSRGILPPKIVTSKGGKRSDFGYLGSGIYFCDNILSSMDFTQPIGDKGSRLIIMSLVSLGNIKEYTVIQPHLTSPPIGFNSCKGVKSNDFKENEFVVYSQNQTKLSFLIEFDYRK